MSPSPPPQGQDVLSTEPGGGYKAADGTSIAVPHVAGAVALYKALYPAATAAQIKRALLDSAVPTPSLRGRTVTGGRLDVARFLGLPQQQAGGGPPAGAPPAGGQAAPKPRPAGGDPAVTRRMMPFSTDG
jgi:subtilisin family serine protease